MTSGSLSECAFLITGATGLIGRKIADALDRGGAKLKILTRNASRAKAALKTLHNAEFHELRDFDSADKMASLAAGTKAVVNLAGTNLSGKRWNTQFKQEIYDSRIDLTRLISYSFKLTSSRPECFISASGVGIYGDRGDELLTEESSAGNDFLAKVCRDWESSALMAEDSGVRTVTVRTGIVLDPNEGALPKLLIPFRFHAGAYHGNGKQWLSWIHVKDITGMYLHAMFDDNMRGPLNGVSPSPVRNKEFMKICGEVLGSKILLPVPGLMLKLAAGEFAESLLGGQRVDPLKARNSGFLFSYPDLELAIRNLTGRSH